jgi:hypothetical protein
MELKRGAFLKSIEYCDRGIKQLDSLKSRRTDLALCYKGFILKMAGDS